jgi:hypothetical protein
METSVSLKHPGFLGFCCSETGSATSLAVKKEKPMSEKNQIVVVLVVALSLGAFVDRITALKIVAGVALLWTLQNQPTVFECIRKVFSFRRGRFSMREYRGGARTVRVS